MAKAAIDEIGPPDAGGIIAGKEFSKICSPLRSSQSIGHNIYTDTDTVIDLINTTGISKGAPITISSRRMKF
jgi:hypothetical protein